VGGVTDLGGELVQGVSLDGVDGKRVVTVDGSEAGRDWGLARFMCLDSGAGWGSSVPTWDYRLRQPRKSD
jgi:hypothetical protein